MPTLATDIQLKVSALLQESSPKSGGIAGSIEVLVRLLDGTGSGKANKAYFAERTLGAGANEVLDLAGVLADLVGNTLTFTKVKLVAFKNLDETDGDDLAVGPDATNGWGAAGYVSDVSDRRRVNAGGADIWYDPNGIAVGAGATDEINVAALVGGVTYRVLIVGEG